MDNVERPKQLPKVPEIGTCGVCGYGTFDGTCVTCSAREERANSERPCLILEGKDDYEDKAGAEKRMRQIRKIMLERKKRESPIRHEEGRMPIALQYLLPPALLEDEEEKED